MFNEGVGRPGHVYQQEQSAVTGPPAVTSSNSGVILALITKSRVLRVRVSLDLLAFRTRPLWKPKAFSLHESLVNVTGK